MNDRIIIGRDFVPDRRMGAFAALLAAELELATARGELPPGCVAIDKIEEEDGQAQVVLPNEEPSGGVIGWRRICLQVEAPSLPVVLRLWEAQARLNRTMRPLYKRPPCNTGEEVMAWDGHVFFEIVGPAPAMRELQREWRAAYGEFDPEKASAL